MTFKAYFLLLTFSFLFILSAQAQIPPVASAVGMTGVMKRNHTLTVTYTYTGTNPQSGTIIQWIRYDDNCGTNPVNIGAGLTTYTLTFFDETKHIGVRVTPRDNLGNLGIPVTYQPWSCAGSSPLHDIGPNPVLLYTANCNNASGVGVPVPGNLIINPGALCSPRSLDWQVEYTGINYRLPDLPARIIIDWADGNAETLAPTLININETNMSKQLWRVLRNHIYNYDAGSAASTTVGSRCTYTMQATWGIGVFTGSGAVGSCGVSGFQQQPFTVWDMEDNTALGTHDVNHDATSAGVQANPPVPLPPSAENVNICQGDTRSIRLRDATDFNCTPPLENPGPNDQGRWVQFVYGTASNITAPGGVGGSIIINGTSYSAAQLPVFGRVIYQEAPGVLVPVHVTDNIQMPTTAVALQQMTVTMRTWNICNPFDLITIPGNGLSPSQAPPFNVFDFRGSVNFQSQAEFPNSNNYFANSTPVLRNYTITIIDKPAPPVAADRDICNSPVESRQLSVSPVVGGLTYRWYLTQADALANINVQVTAANFTPTAAQAPAGQRRHFFVTATAGNNCVSDPEEVMLTVRPTLAQPPVFTGPPNLCPSSNYVYTLPAPAAPVTITDAITGNFNLNTEFQWTVPAAVGAITLGQLTESITITSAAAVGSGSVSVVNRYVTPPATTSGNQCSSTARALTVDVRARPTVNITPDPVNICEGSSQLLNGNPVLPAAAAGFTPSISAHTWGGSTGILDAANIQTPTVQNSTAPGSYGLTYLVTADFGGGVSCSSTTDNLTVNISASPTPANAGPDQNLCIAAPLDATLAGSNPGVGTGTWTRISGPGAAPTFTPNANAQNAVARVFANGVHVFRWTIVNGTCTSFDEVSIDYGTTPPVSTNGGNQDVCSLSATLTGNDPTFATGTWVQTAGPGTSSFVPNANTRNAVVTVTAFGTYTYRWRLTSGTCPPSDSFLDIAFRQAPTVTAPVDFTFCVDNPPTVTIPLSGTFGGGASQARWERVTGTGTFTSNGTAIGNFDNSNPATDVYTPTAADFAAGSVQVRLITDDPTGACTAVNDPVTITIDRRPATAAAGGDFATCDPTANLAATAANNGGTGTWSIGNALYYETFTNPNGTGLSGPNPHALTFTHPTNNWTITAPNANTLLANDDYLRVEGGVMEAQDVNAELVWRSPSINITALPNITVSLQLAEFGTMEAAPLDYIRAFYRLNGAGPEIPIGAINDDAAIDGAFTTFTVSGITGTSIEVIIRVFNESASEFHRFDNVFISSAGAILPFITDVNNPTSSITGLPVGATTFTWTVTSALGVCSSSNDQVIVTRHASPNNFPQTPSLCEDVPTGGTATVSLAFLTSLNDLITGIPTSAGRTVQFFTDPARTIPYPASASLANTDVVYTIVTRTDVVPNCTTNGTVTFTVNSRPAALDQNPEFCEDLPVGSNTRAGIDLTTFNNAVKNGVAANTVAWFSDAALTIPVPVPTNVTANDGTSFFARVTNPATTCTNDAEVEITLNPRPGVNPIIGAPNVCVGTTTILYQIQTIVPGSTYTWSLPPDNPGIFENFAGGGINDFFVLLQFPGLVSPPTSDVYNISVTETSPDGCAGAIFNFQITVEASPSPNPITGPDPVCKEESGVIYQVVGNPLSNYSWSIIAGDAAIVGAAGGVGLDQVTVDFGTTNASTIRVEETSPTGCSAPPATLIVNANDRPSLDILSNTVCSDAPAGITLSGTLATTFNITNVSVPAGLNPPFRATINGALPGEIFNDVFNNNTGGPLTVQYTVFPVSGLNCVGTPRIVNLIIQPEPVLDPGLFDEICSTTDAVNIVLSVASGSSIADQYEITSINNPAGLTQVAGSQIVPGIYTSGILLDDKWQNTTGAPANVEYFIRPRYSVTGCVGDPAIPVSVTVNPEPIVPALPPETMCSGGSPLTTITPSIAGSTFSWTVIGTTGLMSGHSSGSGPSGSAITNVLINSGAGVGTVTYQIVATSPAGMGSCASQPVNFVVTIDPSPTANDIFQTFCSDAAAGSTFLIDLTTLQNSVNSGGGVTFTWSENPSMVPLIATPTSYTLSSGTIYVEVFNGQCRKVATVTSTIHERPSVSASITSSFNGFSVSCFGASNGQITAVPADGTGPYLFSIDGGGSFFTTTAFNGLSVAGGPYVVRVRDSNGCINNSTPLTLTQPVLLTASASVTSNLIPAYNGEDVTCNSASDGIITVVPGAGTGVGPFTFILLELPGNTTGNISGVYTGLRAGTYTFVVTDANSCQATTSTVTVTEPTPVTASAVLTSPVSCNGNSDGVITVTGGGGTLAGPTYTFTLVQAPFTVNTTGVFSGLGAGNYSVDVEDDNGCVKRSNTVSVTQPAVLTAFASVTSNYNGAKISCPGANDAQVTAIANGGNGGYTFVLDQDPLNLTGQADGSFENLGPGSYSITVTDIGTCSVTSALVNVTEPTPITASALATGAISCNGAADGVITISASGGTGSYSYEQILPAGPTNATGTFTGLPQGTYDFEVSDLNGCSDVVTITINQPAVVTASAVVAVPYNGSQVSCNGASDGSITVTAAGGTGAFVYTFDQFVLTNITGQFTGVFTGIPAGVNYTFTVRDVNNCTAVTVPVTITQPPAVSGSGVVSSTYNGEDISCAGASDGAITITPGGGTGAYNFKLDQVPSNTTGDASGIYTGLSAGMYTVTVRDINGCFVVTAPITITPPSALTATAAVTSNYFGRQVSCTGASDGEITVTAGGGVPTYSYLLIEIPGNVTGAATGIFTGVPAGSYTIRVTDLNTCQRITTTVIVNDPPALAANSMVTSNYNGEQVSCNGASDGTIRVTPTGGTSPYTFTFVEIPGNVTGATTGIFTGIPAGTYNFNVLDVNNCPVTTLPITVSEPTVITASAVVASPYNGQQISCNGVDDGTITITALGGTGAATYVFNQVPGNLSGKFSGVFTGIGAGTNYDFTVTDANGCSVTTAPVDVVEPAALSASLNATSDFNGFDISCFNLTDGEVSVVGLAGGTGTMTYLLLENPGNITGQTTGVFTGLRAGSYRVRVTDQNFCQIITAAIPVTQPTDINVQIAITSDYNGFDVSCLGAADGEVSVTTIAGGATATSVSFELDQDLLNVTGNATGIYAGLVSGLYTVTATDANNCSKQSLPVVLIDPLPLFEGIVGLDKSVCAGGDPTAFTELASAFGSIGNYAYQWMESTDGVLFTNVLGANSATFDPPAVPVTTFYKRQITSGTCATLESNVVKVTVNPLPTVSITATPSPVCEGEFFILEFSFPIGQAPFFFDFNDGTTFTNDRLGASVTPVPVINYTDTKTYTVTEVRDFNGCFAPVLPAPLIVPVIKINPAFVITSPSAQCSGGQFDFEFTVDPDVEYTWIWGDGQTEVIAANTLPNGINPISHIYESFNTAGTTNFPVILTAINNVEGCGPKQTSRTIQIFPNILINLFPDKTEICGGDDVTFTNPTAGGSTHHWFYRRQGFVEMLDERTFVAASTQTFTFNNTSTVNPQIFELVYEVNNANCAADTVIEITVYREVAASFSKTTPIPLFMGGNANMTFTNTSVPIDGAEFQYDWDFGTAASQPPVSGLGPFNFNYTAPGTKTVNLLATNLVALANGLTCTSQYQETFNILLPPLMAAFEYTPQAICFPANISITENLATGNTYTWRLVDGTGRQLLVSNDSLPTFNISSPGRFTIFLTTTNTITGQSESADNSGSGNNTYAGDPDPNDFDTPIDIYDPPFAGFEARPTVVFVPDQELQTFNLSSSSIDPQTALAYPIEYRWYFGDGTDTLSTEDDPNNFEPLHLYLNEGMYTVALLAINDHGDGAVCIDTATQAIQAKAAGFTRVPNAFTPSPNGPTGGAGGGGNSVNDVFLPIAKGVVEFQMQIFDRWGNLVFESQDKNIGWDGYDRHGNLLPAGVYVYKLVMRMSNDQRTTQIGDVTLIR